MLNKAERIGLCQGVASLDKVINPIQGQGTISSMIKDDSSNKAIDVFLIKKTCRSNFVFLNDYEKDVLYHRFGLNNKLFLTFDEIMENSEGQKSKQFFSQKYNRAMNILILFVSKEEEITQILNDENNEILKSTQKQFLKKLLRYSLDADDFPSDEKVAKAIEIPKGEMFKERKKIINKLWKYFYPDKKIIRQMD